MIVQSNIVLYIFLIFSSILCVVTTYKYSIGNNVGNLKFEYHIDNNVTIKKLFDPAGLEDHRYIVQKYFEPRKDWITSNLGAILFKNEKYTSFSRENKFIVLVWRHWKFLKVRHAHKKNNAADILKDCSVTNCVFTRRVKTLPFADAVLVFIEPGLLPVVNSRNQDQIWVFYTDESPINTFNKAKKKPKLRKWANIFNWSMSYRSDAEVPVPYGRTVPLEMPIDYPITHDSILSSIPYLKYKRSNVLVTVVMSNCKAGFRMKFLKQLQQYIEIDVYGACAEVQANRWACPGHSLRDCAMINKYYFYLVLENSMCRQYLTEKVFYNAYPKGAIPIIVGPSLHDCTMLLPPYSFIHYANFPSPRDLAAKIIKTYMNMDDFLSYHLWRNHFRILNEHGYFHSKSYHFCRLCEALNYNKKEKKMYDLDELRLFLNPELLCRNKL